MGVSSYQNVSIRSAGSNLQVVNQPGVAQFGRAQHYQRLSSERALRWQQVGAAAHR
jgi:hypothetical protein